MAERHSAREQEARSGDRSMVFRRDSVLQVDVGCELGGGSLETVEELQSASEVTICADVATDTPVLTEPSRHSGFLLPSSRVDPREFDIHPTDLFDRPAIHPEEDRKSTRLNSSHSQQSRMPSSA